MANYTPKEREKIIQERLQAEFKPGTLTITDESHHHAGHPGAKEGAGHYAITIVAPEFEGLSLLKRHQLVYEQLKDLIPQEIHALRINARAPAESKEEKK